MNGKMSPYAKEWLDHQRTNEAVKSDYHIPIHYIPNGRVYGWVPNEQLPKDMPPEFIFLPENEWRKIPAQRHVTLIRGKVRIKDGYLECEGKTLCERFTDNRDMVKRGV